MLNIWKYAQVSLDTSYICFNQPISDYLAIYHDKIIFGNKQ